MTRLPEIRGNDLRGSDRRGTDPRGNDPRGNDPRGNDLRGNDLRSPIPRIETVREEAVVPITFDTDIVSARHKSRELAAKTGFSFIELTLIATAVSELARNIVLYGGGGEIHLKLVENGTHRGIVVVARDQGRGIADIPRALQDGYSTSGSLGLGLPGTRRLMDEFEIVSTEGKGTTVTVKKWKR
jgi:serine/threonine-protein kinase RsbT